MFYGAIAIFTCIFIAYEVHKVMNASRQMFVVFELNEELAGINAAKYDDKKVRLTTLDAGYYSTFIIEIFYMLFCLILLFTKFWFIALLIFALVFIKDFAQNRTSISMNVIWFTDCFVTIALLSAILYQM